MTCRLNTVAASLRTGIVFALSGCVLFCATSQGAVVKNETIKPGMPWLDSEGVHINAHGFGILSHEGKYYWYGAHKIAGKTKDEKNEAGVRCYVSTDLLNWTNAGLVLDVFAPGMSPELRDAFILDRPKVIYHAATKRFILYFKLYPPKEQGGKTGKDFAYVGVATSPTPTGPFEYQGRFLGAGSETGSGDFAIYQDADGAVYHIAVRKPDKGRKDKPLVCGRLSEDGLKPAGDYIVMEGVINATEGPALFRRAGKYYLLGSQSTGWKPNPARLFVADQLTGPYQLLGNPCRGVNPHNQLGPEKTFGGQSTFVFPMPGKQDEWIAMFDTNNPSDPINAGYIWLPLEFKGDEPVIRWREEWNLSVSDGVNGKTVQSIARKFSPGLIWPDNNGVHINAHGGGVIFFEDRYYWFGEHKLAGRSEAQMAGGGVHCYSSADLHNWQDEGVVLPVDRDNPKSDIAAGCILERPKVIYNETTKTFVMFFKSYPKGKGYEFGYVGVATATRPNGPFTYRHRFLGCGSPNGSGDFAIVRDRDGGVYHLAVRKPDKVLCAGKLRDDYLLPAVEYRPVAGIEHHTEAPAIVARPEGFYLFGSGSTGWKPNAARAYFSTNLTGPYRPLDNPCEGVNPHNGLGPDKTFGGQISFVLPVAGKTNAYIAMFDLWKPEAPIEGLYAWLPLKFEDGKPAIEWRTEWNLNSLGK